jgi:hypothetical protein
MIDSSKLLDIENATLKELISEWDSCQKDWGKYSSDCYGYYIDALHKQIVKLGGWPL